MADHVCPAPIHLLAGGPGSRRSEGDPLLARALACSSVARPAVAYVGAASGDNRAFFEMLAGYLRLCGAGEVALAPLAGRRARVDRAQAILERADVVFVGGGDVQAGMQVLEARGIIPFLRKLHEGGTPFLGVSAGSIMLARQWVCWADPADDASARTFPCLGFAPILCDTHGEAEGWEELRALLRLAPEGALGYGIPTGAGLAVQPDGRVEVLGAPICRFERRGQVERISDLPKARV